MIKKNNQTETPQASTTTINFYYQNGNDLKSSINVDLSTTYYCAISIENANFYETSGYYTEKMVKASNFVMKIANLK